MGTAAKPGEGFSPSRGAKGVFDKKRGRRRGGSPPPRGIGPPAVYEHVQHAPMRRTRYTRARPRACARAETHRVVVDDLF